MTLTRYSVLATLFVIALLETVDAFSTVAVTSKNADASRLTRSSSPLFAGGFGGGAGGGGGGGTGMDKKSKGKGVKTSGGGKLKPKQQWDRFKEMKTETKFRVGIRMTEDDSDAWLEVGRVRSKEGAHTISSVAVQRALIAEHAKRLYPLQVSSKKTLEWAYFEESSDDWVVVDKSILETTPPPEGIEKLVGFEGQPDPATGFYCVYDGGKIKLGDESSFK